jgi:hypothetical protein
MALILTLGPSVAAGDRISALVVGVVTPTYNPFSALFAEDPLFTYRAYPVCGVCSQDESRKLARMYYPRTRDELTSNYRVMAFCEARIEHFLTRQLHDLDYAFREAGMVGAASPGCSWDSAWMPTILYDLMPVSQYYDYVRLNPYRVVFVREREPVFTPFTELGMEKVTGKNYHYMTPRGGATIWAEMRPNRNPWLVSWRPGGSNAGMMWVFTGTFDAPWWGLVYGSAGDNPYAIDMLTNLLFYSLDMPLIQDIHGRREARTVLSTFQARKLLALHVMEWADKFGANILPLSQQVIVVEAEAEEAMEHYIEQDYAGTVTAMEAMSQTILKITEEAVRLKNETMAWIYASEWLVVSSTSLITGTVIWGLLVRRRMYRKAGSTRLRHTMMVIPHSHV